VHRENFGVYGTCKVWMQLDRRGVPVPCCTADRLTKSLGIKGVRRGAFKVTTTSDAIAHRRECIDWFNNWRLFEPIGDFPPAEYEMLY